jgi:hypothetical protein
MLTDEAPRKNAQHRLSEHAILRLVTACMTQSGTSTDTYKTRKDNLNCACNGQQRSPRKAA